MGRQRIGPDQTTRTGTWCHVWRLLEDAGIPIDQGEAKRWDFGHDSAQASALLNTLDDLYLLKMPLDAIHLIAQSIIAAYKMGQAS